MQQQRSIRGIRKRIRFDDAGFAAGTWHCGDCGCLITSCTLREDDLQWLPRDCPDCGADLAETLTGEDDEPSELEHRMDILVRVVADRPKAGQHIFLIGQGRAGKAVGTESVATDASLVPQAIGPPGVRQKCAKTS
jgi:hypothetical protein